MDTVKILLSKLPFIGHVVDVSKIPLSAKAIIFNIRTPRVIMAVFVGMGLSLCGGVYQGMFKNGMADPYVLGIHQVLLFLRQLQLFLVQVT